MSVSTAWPPVLRTRSWAVIGGVIAAILLGLALPDLRITDVPRDRVSAADSTSDGQATPGQQGAGTPRQQASNPTAPSRSKPRPRTLAWAGVQQATGYQVELFREGTQIFEATTKSAQLKLPARWRHGGKTQSLRPGDYQWYVWPVVDGRRATEAIVQAKLVVSAD